MVVCGRRAEPLAETAAAAEGGRCTAIACDIREEEQVDALVGEVLERHGRVDLLVNNAGGQYLTPAEDITPKGFRTVLRLNVEGTWLMTHAVATRAMMGGRDGRPRGGRIVNVTLSPHHGLPGMAHSSAARAAVENLTRVLSIEWARFGIRLTALAAGPFATETLRTKYPKPVVEGWRARSRSDGWAPRRNSPGSWPTSPPRPATTSPARCSRSTAPATTGSVPGRPAARGRGRKAARGGAQAAVVSVPELRTERLLLRGWRDGDLDGWAELCADDEAMRLLGRDGGLTPAEAWREMAFFAGHWELKGYGHWVLEELGAERSWGARACCDLRTGPTSRSAGRSRARAGDAATRARQAERPSSGRAPDWERAT